MEMTSLKYLLSSVGLNNNLIQNDYVNGQRYDYCLVFPTINGELVENRGQNYFRIISQLGFEYYAFKVEKKHSAFAQVTENIKSLAKVPENISSLQPLGSLGSSKNKTKSSDDTMIFVLLRAPIHKLREYAIRTHIKIQLDPMIVQEVLEKGDPERHIAPVKIRHEPEVSRIHPYQHLYADYSEEREFVFWKGDNRDKEEDPFRELIRLRTTTVMLESRPRYTENGEKKFSENLKIMRYLKNKWLLGCFCLHTLGLAKNLETRWNKYPFKGQPLYEIKEYFGEKVGIYYAFIGHYTAFLTLPALIALPFQIVVFFTDNYSLPIIPVFSIFLAIWSIVLLEYWKRKQTRFAMEWGSLGFEGTEHERPEFKGKEAISHIDGSMKQYFSSRLRNIRISLSTLAIGGLIALVLGSVSSIYIMRFAISPVIGNANAQTVASIINSVLIQLLNSLYSFLANALTEWENHRTDTEFEDSMITKIFMFQFVNSYASFFYLAFVAQLAGDCPDTGCMPALAYNLGIIFGTRLISGNLISQILVPFITFRMRIAKYCRRYLTGDTRQLTMAEKEYLKTPVNLQKHIFDAYSDATLQFGYNSLFASALPMASTYALFLNIAQIKSDAWQWFALKQRPSPKNCEDIGSWQVILEVMCAVSVVTNSALIVFTMNIFHYLELKYRFWIFFGFQWVLFILQSMTKVLISDNPEEVRVQLLRNEFVERKVVLQEPDDMIGFDPMISPQTTIAFQPIPFVQHMEVFPK